MWTDEPRPASVYHAMMLGLRDYVRKNGFPGVLLGLSGGIDSALTAAVAVDALGSDRVRGMRLPSVFTTAPSLDDAAETARLLGIRCDTLSIEGTVASAESALAPLFADRPRDVAEENLQARVRGLLLMGLSNKFGHLLVTTGNKSEMSVGYATLYGDMCGGYSVLKDVYKTEVYALSRWRNAHHPGGALGPTGCVIPESSITKAPTAELRANQTDQDSLPPYEVLDAILNGLVEDERSVAEIVGRGYDRDTVTRVQRLLYSAEYKRRQAPPASRSREKGSGGIADIQSRTCFERRRRRRAVGPWAMGYRPWAMGLEATEATDREGQGRWRATDQTATATGAGRKIPAGADIRGTRHDHAR